MPSPSFMATPRAPMRGQASPPIVGGTPEQHAAGQIRSLATKRLNPTGPEPLAPPPARQQQGIGGGGYQAPRATSPAGQTPYQAALGSVSQSRLGQGSTAQGLTGTSTAGNRYMNPMGPAQNTFTLTPGAAAGVTPGQVALASSGALDVGKRVNENQPMLRDKAQTAVAQELIAALTGSNADYSAMTPEMLAAQAEKLNAAGNQQQYNLQRSLAAQGIGSGMGLADIGGIGVQTARAVADADTAAALQGQEARMQAIRDLLQGFGGVVGQQQTQQQIDTSREDVAYQREQQAEADKWAAINNIVGLTGSQAMTAYALAQALNTDMNDPKAVGELLRWVTNIETSDGTKLGAGSGAPGSNPQQGRASNPDPGALSGMDKSLYDMLVGTGWDPSAYPGDESGMASSDWDALPLSERIQWYVYNKLQPGILGPNTSTGAA